MFVWHDDVSKYVCIYVCMHMSSSVISCVVCIYCSFWLLNYASSTKHVCHESVYYFSGNKIEHQHLCTRMLCAKKRSCRVVNFACLFCSQLEARTKENRELQNQFESVLRTNHEVEQMLRNMQSEKAAAESRVKELTMVVNQVVAENEALTQQNSQLVQQNEVRIAFDICCVSTWSPSECVCTSVCMYSTNLIVVLLRY